MIKFLWEGKIEAIEQLGVGVLPPYGDDCGLHLLYVEPGTNIPTYAYRGLDQRPRKEGTVPMRRYVRARKNESHFSICEDQSDECWLEVKMRDSHRKTVRTVDGGVMPKECWPNWDFHRDECKCDQQTVCGMVLKDLDLSVLRNIR